MPSRLPLSDIRSGRTFGSTLSLPAVYPIERLAASATYKFNRNLSLTVDGTNLTNRPQRAYWGSEAIHDRVYFEGRTFSAAMRFKF